MRPAFLFLCICALGATLQAGVLVNEAMVNEPGSDVTLEWIELYNDSADAIDLNRCLLGIGGSSVQLSGFLAPGQFMIICRNLISTGTSPGYESVWGDSSGLWGDTPEEAELLIAEESFSLLNTTGTIQLYSVSTLLSELSWTGTGADGYSWERITPSNSAAVNSIDPTGSTPGRANSVSPVALDLAIDTVLSTSEPPGAEIRVVIVNLGADTAKAQSLLLYHAHSPDTANTQDPVLSIDIDTLAPGKRDTLVIPLEETGIYSRIGVLLSGDDRLDNNLAFAWVTGQQFPPIILSEFLPDPRSPLTSEWIELHNISDSTINIAGWTFGDELNLRLISSTTYMLAPGARIVVAQDSVSFKQFYSTYNGPLIEPTSWTSFNNAGDLVRVVDGFGYTADRHQYTAGYGDNFTFSRDESETPDGPWNKSATTGGTPGEENQIWTQPTGDRTTITIVPQVFSPDGDGFEDETVISLTAAEASAYTLKIYDRSGRLVKTFVDGQPSLQGSFTWNGYSDAGGRLPIGIYICYFEAEGVESIKETVVIAR